MKSIRQIADALRVKFRLGAQETPAATLARALIHPTTNAVVAEVAANGRLSGSAVDATAELSLGGRGLTPLTNRRLEAGSNVRAMVLGDSIAAGLFYGDNFGVLRVLQSHIGNGGGGGIGINTQLIEFHDGATDYSADNPTDWFRKYTVVGDGDSYEMSATGRVRVFCNSVRVAWRAPVGGASTFKIQTCTDNDGEGVGTWVDQGGTRTAEASGASEEVGTATISLTEGRFRLRVLSVSGTVDVFHMELSHSTSGGVVLLPFVQGSTALSALGDVSVAMREQFMEAVDPDVILIAYKDGETIEDALEALAVTLETSLSGAYPRDVVLVAPFASLPVDGDDYDAMEEQRVAMRKVSLSYGWAFVDLFDLFPKHSVYYDGPGVHVAGDSEYAYQAGVVLDQLGWLQYPKTLGKSQPAIRQDEKTAFTELANNTTLTEYLRIRGLAAGTYRLSGYFLFSNVSTAGEGGKAEVSFTGTATCRAYRWHKFSQTTGFGAMVVTPAFGANPALPIAMDGMTGFDDGYGFDFIGTIIVTAHGDVIVKVAKEVASASTLYFREGSFIRAEKIA